jgi:two-component system sensor histidine kinase YesM
MFKTIQQQTVKLYSSMGNLTLQSKLVVSYVLIILLPIIFLSIYIFNGFYQNYIKDAVKNNEYLLEIEKLNIDNNMALMERTLQLTKSDKKVTDYLERSSAPHTQELIDFYYNAFMNLLRVQFNNPTIEHIRIYSNNDYLNEIWPVFFRVQRVVDKPWHALAMQLSGSYLWQLERLDPDVVQRYSSEHNEKRPKTSLYQQIRDPIGTHLGIIEVDMLMSNFFPKTFSNVQDPQSQMLIIDRDLQIYTNEDNSFWHHSTLSQYDILEQFQLHQTKATNSFEFVNDDIPYLCNFIFIERLDAYMLNVGSLEAVFKDIHKTRNTIIFASIILIIILSLSTYYLNSLILKRLQILADSMKKVRRGDFNFEIDIRGKGEIGELAHHFRNMLSKINQLIAEGVNKRASTKEAELKSLKNQIDAHFLYNTLENIKMLAEIEQQYKISDALTSLGGMIRYNLNWTSDYVRLRDEISHIKNYIAIMNIRYECQMAIDIDMLPEYGDQEVLKMCLQPIVENSVKHGIGVTSLGAQDMILTMKTIVDHDMLIIEISDNGIGMSKMSVEELNRKINQEPLMTLDANIVSGIGLRNVHQRIQLHYGIEYGIKVESAEGVGTKVTMRIPLLNLSGGQSEHA